MRLSSIPAVLAIAVLAAFLLLVSSMFSRQAKADADDAGSKFVAAYLKTHCIACHGPDKKESGLALHKLDPDMAKAKNADVWQRVAERIQKGEMPPEEKPRPKALESRRFVAWINEGLKKAGKSIVAADLIATGNQVEHDALFSAKTKAAFHSPPRVWRISPHIYDQLVVDIARKGKLKLPRPLSGTGGTFDDQAGGLVIDEPTTAQLIRNATALVATQTKAIEDGKPKGGNVMVRDFAPLFNTATPPSKAQKETAIRHQFKIVLQRPPSDEELKRFVTFMDKTMKDAGQVLGAKTALSAVYLLPEVLFRLELGAGQTDAQGRIRLAPREIAYAIAFALTDARPDQTLLDAAASGRLATAEGVAVQVRRLLGDSTANQTRILRFFQEFFGYHEAPFVFKDPKDFPPHAPELLVKDTDRLVLHVLASDKDVFKQLLTTRTSFVGYKQDKPGKKQDKKPEKKAKPKDANWLSYNLTAPPEAQPAKLPAEQRMGILTQPSWLVAHSLNAENHAIRRGKWVRERLLGGLVPDLPITVDAQLPEDPKRTLRQRMDVTREAYCWNCHKRMNDLGLAFEMFDHFGRFRTTEIGKPVDSSGKIALSGDAKLDGDVTNALDLIGKLADSPRSRQVFVRHAFRYWLGREENLGDAPSLIAVDQAYVSNGGSMKALLTALLTSDSFLYRSAAEAGQ